MFKNGVFAALMMAVAVTSPTLTSIAVSLDGKLFPVLRNNQIESYTTKDQKTVITGKVEKVRDCIYRDVEWYYTDSKGVTSVIPFIELNSKGSTPHGVGTFRYGPIEFPIPSMNLNNTYVVVYHQCHPWFPGWTTRSVVKLS